MAQRNNYKQLAGSEHRHPKEHKKMKPTEGEEMTMVTLILRRREGAMPDLVDFMPGMKGAEKKPNRKEFAESHGADPQEMKIVEKFARAHHLEIVESHPARRAVVMRGKVEDINKAFGLQPDSASKSA